jgi:hypothetical protein
MVRHGPPGSFSRRKPETRVRESRKLGEIMFLVEEEGLLRRARTQLIQGAEALERERQQLGLQR